ncbi:unnamed protein product [Mytilus coruscus]|uniref:Uncharacterized protein n=1 Tax=Mytilus coruscus TaxID=42192 RepID=A0A6J8CML1_MYTCO|nr:unnamed protein product [Mytilus coruscus]
MHVTGPLTTKVPEQEKGKDSDHEDEPTSKKVSNLPVPPMLSSPITDSSFSPLNRNFVTDSSFRPLNRSLTGEMTRSSTSSPSAMRSCFSRSLPAPSPEMVRPLMTPSPGMVRSLMTQSPAVDWLPRDTNNQFLEGLPELHMPKRRIDTVEVMKLAVKFSSIQIPEQRKRMDIQKERCKKYKRRWMSISRSVNKDLASNNANYTTSSDDDETQDLSSKCLNYFSQNKSVGTQGPRQEFIESSSFPDINITQDKSDETDARVSLNQNEDGINEEWNWDMIDQHIEITDSEDEDEGEGEGDGSTILTDLSEWVTENLTKQNATDKLLKILIKNGHKNLPSTVMTLLQTKRHIDTQVVSDMEYYNFGLEKGLKNNLEKKPRGLEEIDYLKAIEYRQFLLYTGKLVLKDVLKRELYEHFMSFSVAMTILMSKQFVVEGFSYYSVAVAHKEWIRKTKEGENACYWPFYNQSARARKGEVPDEERWKIYSVRIFGYSDSFEMAVMKSKLAKDTSNIESEDEEETQTINPVNVQSVQIKTRKTKRSQYI